MSSGGCTSLVDINIPKSVEYIGGKAFEGTPWLTSQPDGDVIINDIYYTYKGELPADGTVTVPEGIRTIAGGAFYYRGDLKAIHLPESLTYIGDGAFMGCTSLESVKLPDGVTYIGDGAFLDCSSLKKAELSKKLTYIDDSAFNRCAALTEIYIPEGVTYIGSAAFCFCDSLSEVRLPSTLEKIGEAVFDYALQIIRYGGTKSEWKKLKDNNVNVWSVDADVRIHYNQP